MSKSSSSTDLQPEIPTQQPTQSPLASKRNSLASQRSSSLKNLTAQHSQQVSTTKLDATEQSEVDQPNQDATPTDQVLPESTDQQSDIVQEDQQIESGDQIEQSADQSSTPEDQPPVDTYSSERQEDSTASVDQEQFVAEEQEEEEKDLFQTQMEQLDDEIIDKQLEDEYQNTIDTTRILESPLPEDSETGFLFVNVDYEADPDMPVIFMSSKLSRTNSVIFDDIDFEGGERPKGGVNDMVYVCRPVTPILRPTTPEKIVVSPLEVGFGQDELMGIGSLVGVTKAGLNGSIVLPDARDNIDRESLIADIRAVWEIKEKQSLKNLGFQNLLGEYFRRKRTDEARDGEKSVTDQEKRYANCMSALADLGKEYEANNASNQKNVTEYKVRLQEKIDDASIKSVEFMKMKRQTALQAENSRTGKPIPVKFVDQLESTEQRKEAEVVSVRLENIKLRNKLRRYEQLLRQKEELADGLHLIDFEQLKIENQSYNEKIEERNEELLKLRKKITNIVQVLTHVKEKLQFVQTENIVLNETLSVLDKEVSTKRDALPSAKKERDMYRLNNIALKQGSGLLGNVPLLMDFEKKVDESKSLNEKIDQLRDYHQQLAAENIKLKRKINKAQLSS